MNRSPQGPGGPGRIRSRTSGPNSATGCELNPGLQAKTLFEDLQRRFPGRFPDGQLRTLQRKIKAWKAVEGPPKEVFFDQVHTPGELAASDFTCMNDLHVTLAGRAVRSPGLSLRADLLQLGDRHGLLLREFREPQPGAPERPVGTGRGSPDASDRSAHRRGEQPRRPRPVPTTLPRLAGPLRLDASSHPGPQGQPERRCRAEP